ncbi:crotonase/enoyl-CoA hydratase family protein [Yoonia vestfoldensis]|uniref:1,4-dihydroxy-2-naphthoyl-CoA synthase n=1 Tax=Yoonia vestfoldensis TaxID=245188 RepID=A0A1Y0ECR0_9RHOB|nr:crotonase/enoyl-CoA hydratase family protein [Yoonia vestfoldensis]ARU01122.1 1,4-dihydroxy-2-naphthoyl-CoA synthase [Yoonia vestfoldensis]
MIDLVVDGRGVARLTLARADKHNALSQAMIDALTQAAATIAADSRIRVVVLAAEGPTFCAGGDLGWMRDQMAADRQTRRAAAFSLARMLGALNQLPQPVIGRIQGNAFGGGIGLACICDVAIGVQGARFGLTETRLGLIPATIGPYVLARMGEAKARRVFMSGRVFDASEAVALDLLARAVPPAALDEAVDAEITPYLSCGPAAVAAAKRYARSLGPVIDDSVIAQSVAALLACWDGPEAAEGIAAFFDKRPPHWPGLG